MFNVKLRTFFRAALCAGIGGMALTATPVLAHHSMAMFDSSKVLTRKAVVRLWEFTNPHATLWIYIDNDKGEAELWGLEAPAPGQLTRTGWSKNTVKPGDAVTVAIAPLRDGRNGGNLIKLTLADGRTLVGGAPGGDGPGGNRPPGAPPPGGASDLPPRP